MGKISGPLLDRIDLQVEVQPVNFDQMSSKAPGEPSAAIRERVIKARAIQSLRYKNHPGIHCNAQMTTAMLHKYVEPDAEGMAQLRDAITKMNMSATKIQIWITLIANLLLMVLQRRIKRSWSFSGLATMVRYMLMYYINVYTFFEEPEKDWLKMQQELEIQPREPTLFPELFD